MVQECGTERIAGCQFNLSVMSDDFAEVILGALDQVDTSKVWKETDDVFLQVDRSQACQGTDNVRTSM